jgi:hypothetical protein
MRFTRRRFLGASIAAGAAVTLAAPAFVRARGLNEKLNIASIGTGGMGGADLGSLAGENVVRCRRTHPRQCRRAVSSGEEIL